MLVRTLSFMLHGTAAGGCALGVHEFFADIDVFIAWATGINIWTFIAMGMDKFAAGANIWRISERTLLLLAFFGGFPGLHMGRLLFNHKTTKQSFINAMWLVAAAQSALLAFYLWV